MIEQAPTVGTSSPIRIATYERVSTVDQKERETILTQYAELQRRVESEPSVVVVQRYVDDGFTGMLELGERPAGAQLLADAADGKFQQLWVYKIDRLGRDGIDPLVVRKTLERSGVSVFSITESAEHPLMYALLVAFAAHEHSTLMERSRAGTERAARAGRYVGGIIALGLVVPGRKQFAHYEIDEDPFWEGMSAAGLIRWMYELLAIDGWSPERIAEHWNALGVPTAYEKDGRLVAYKKRGKRKENTEGVWRGSRIRTMALLPIYKGVTTYGKHPPKRRDGTRPLREVIHGKCVAIVSEEIWEAAQVAIRGRRKWNPGDPRAMHLLRSLIHCAHCGLNYSGGNSRGRSWYKCNGRMTPWARHHGRCHASAVDGAIVEPLIKRDIASFLLFPGDVVDELVAEVNDVPGEAVEAAEDIVLRSRLDGLASERARLIHLAKKGLLTDDELAQGQAEVEHERATLERRLAEVTSPPKRGPKQHRPVVADDLLEQLREKVEEGLSEEQWRDLFTLLVKGVVATTEIHDGQPRLRLQIQYNFAPEHERGVSGHTDTREGQNSTTVCRVLQIPVAARGRTK